MVNEVEAKLGPLPHDAPKFDTERFVVMPLNPAKAKALVGVLLQDPQLAEAVPWLEEKTADGASKEAFLIELQCAAGATIVWGIVERARAMFIGAAVARYSVGGIDLEVLCASQFWDQGVGDEVLSPVAEWLEHATEVELTDPAEAAATIH